MTGARSHQREDGMAEPNVDDMVAPGWDVFDSEHERIGSVEEVTDAYLRVEGETGIPLFIPLDYVETAAGGEVSLDSPASEAAALGWHVPPEG
jgi:hypothetical protein